MSTFYKVHASKDAIYRPVTAGRYYFTLFSQKLQYLREAKTKQNAYTYENLGRYLSKVLGTDGRYFVAIHELFRMEVMVDNEKTYAELANPQKVCHLPGVKYAIPYKKCGGRVHVSVGALKRLPLNIQKRLKIKRITPPVNGLPAECKCIYILQVPKITSRFFFPNTVCIGSHELKGYTPWADPRKFYMFPEEFRKQVPEERRKDIVWVDPGELVAKYEKKNITKEKRMRNQILSNIGTPTLQGELSISHQELPLLLVQNNKAFLSDRTNTDSNSELIIALSAWVHSRLIFVFDDALSEIFLNDVSTVDIVRSEVLLHFPFNSAYIIAKDTDHLPISFFVTRCDDSFHLYLVTPQGKEKGIVLPMRPKEKIEDSLHRIGHSSDLDCIRKMLQLCLCLSCSETSCGEVKIGEKATSGDTRSLERCKMNAEDQKRDAEIYTVIGFRANKVKGRPGCNKGTKRITPCQHIRRGHWHHVWVGSRKNTESRHLTVRWYPETVVNSSDERPPIKITVVRNISL